MPDNEDPPSEAGDEPLVLVVEDNEEALEHEASYFRKAGCRVIPAATKALALTVLRDGPNVDLVVTDIHLGKSAPQGGIELARTVHSEYDDQLPIAAYSGHVYGQMSEQDKSLFIERQDRGTHSRGSKERFALECTVHARRYRAMRLERSHSQIGEAGSAAMSEAAVQFKSFVFADDIDALENDISSLGYELKLIGSSSFKELATTVAVWLRVLDGEFEAQVCGQPLLHWQGDTEAEALTGLVAVMDGFASDLRGLGTAPVGPALRLRDFLELVIVGGAGKEMPRGD